MKKNMILVVAICCITASSFAATFTITLSGMSFSPSSITVHPGDVIKWQWLDGTHTTTSEVIPATAAPWNQNINSGSTTFSYTVTALGTYNYQCNFHVSMGMVGVINVVSATGVNQVAETNLFNMYPNPVSGSLHIQLNNSDLASAIVISDIMGREALRKNMNALKETDIDISNIPNGTYFLRMDQGGKVSKQEIVIAH